MRQAHTAYLSPTDSWRGTQIEFYDGLYRRRCEQGSENLRRAMVRYYHKRSGVSFG